MTNAVVSRRGCTINSDPKKLCLEEGCNSSICMAGKACCWTMPRHAFCCQLIYVPTRYWSFIGCQGDTLCLKESMVTVIYLFQKQLLKKFRFIWWGWCASCSEGSGFVAGLDSIKCEKLRALREYLHGLCQTKPFSLTLHMFFPNGLGMWQRMTW